MIPMTHLRLELGEVLIIHLQAAPLEMIHTTAMIHTTHITDENKLGVVIIPTMLEVDKSKMEHPTKYRITYEGPYYIEPHEDGEFVTYADYKKLEVDRDLWQHREAEARRGIPACELCPHLGSGDPLVDPNTRQLIEALEDCVNALDRLMGDSDIDIMDLNVRQKACAILQNQRGSNHVGGNA